MSKPISAGTVSGKSRYRWRWVLVLLGVLSWVSIGCSPASLSMFINALPFSDPNIPPEYKLFAADKELTLAIVSNFVRPEIQPELQAADAELADLLAATIRKRCTENKHKIKIISSAEVRSFRLKQLEGGQFSPVEIGKKLKADYVLDLTINSFGLYEKLTYPPMYRGKADIAVNLYKVEVKDGDHKVFAKEFPRIFPSGSGPVDATSMSSTQFRGLFLAKVANDVSKMLISYPPEEKRVLE